MVFFNWYAIAFEDWRIISGKSKYDYVHINFLSLVHSQWLRKKLNRRDTKSVDEKIIVPNETFIFGLSKCISCLAFGVFFSPLFSRKFSFEVFSIPRYPKLKNFAPSLILQAKQNRLKHIFIFIQHLSLIYWVIVHYQYNNSLSTNIGYKCKILCYKLTSVL